MRGARVLTTLDLPGEGEHVGWIVDGDEEFARGTERFLAQGAGMGDRLLAFGPCGHVDPAFTAREDVTFIDPASFLDGDGFAPDVVCTRVREQAVVARAEGYRSLRVIADMDWLSRASGDTAQMREYEQKLDRVAAETGASIVCAYRSGGFHDDQIAAVMCVHPQELGRVKLDHGFRIWNDGADQWRLSGEVDLSSRPAFAAALHTATHSRHTVWLDVGGLRFIDVAGLRAIAERAHTVSGLTLTVQGADHTTRRCWKLAEFDAAAPNVEFV